MNGKMMMAFGFCFLMSVAAVSAMSVEETVAKYDRRANTVSVDFDIVLNQECAIYNVAIKNRRGETIDGYFRTGSPICKIIQGGRVIMDFSKTGTFEQSHEFELDKRARGRLTYEITNHYTGEVLDEGRITNVRPTRARPIRMVRRR